MAWLKSTPACYDKKKHKTINELAWSNFQFLIIYPNQFHTLAIANKLLHTSIKM